MSNSLYETECAQVDALIQQKKDEIKALEELKNSWSEDSWDNAETTSPAKVAADSNASSEERAAAANATLGQSPERVNAEQSFPTPSTHDEAKEENERRYEQLHKDLNDKAQRDDRDQDKDLHAFDNESQGVDLPDGRRNVNEVGKAGQVEEGSTVPDSSKERTVESGDADQSKEDKAFDQDAKDKQAETNKNKADVATKGKTDDKSKSSSTKKAESKDK